MVIDNKILKIGQTITDVKCRIQSYNSGKKKHRKKGTCSTTNYFILQSLLNIDKRVNLYVYFAEKKPYDIFGVKGNDCFPSAKVIEKIIINDFIDQFKKNRWDVLKLKIHFYI